MNRIYRLCWNRSLSQWVPASELASCRRSGASRSAVVGQRLMMFSLLSASLGMTGLAHAGNAPTGGQVVAGSGQISQSGNTTTIQQNSRLLSLNWQSFDVGADQTVNFNQPGASSIAVNRILGNTSSEIFGHLNANGQVWLINPNGVLFGQNAQVNVGGIVASTLDVDASTLGSNSVRFSGNGKGTVTNQGSITAANGGYVALIGNQVSNQGVIRAQLGTVALGGGSAVTLTFSDNHLLHLEVDESTLNNLAENRQLIVADGGQVVMTAGARDSLLASAVNNTGTVQARSVQDHNGVITLLGGMEAGTVNVGGTLDASAPNGGDGGHIETSAAHFALAGDAKITAAAPQGKAGGWLIDPTDLTISDSDVAAITSALDNGTPVDEQADDDITLSAGVNIGWTNAAGVLTFDAGRNIDIEGTINGAGGVVMNAKSGTLTIGSSGGISAGTGATVNANAFVNSAGANALGAKWLAYTASPLTNTLGGLTPNYIQYNTASGSTALLGTGNGLIYALAPTLNITGLTGTVSKVYDNTNTANGFTGANFNTTGLVNGDTIGTATGGSYASVNAGSGITVTSPGAIGNFTLFDSTGTIPVFGYALGTGSITGKIGQITPAQLTAQIVNDPTKVYDGTTTATLGTDNYEIDGFFGGQGATVKQPSSIAYAGSDAGSVALNATFSVTNFVANAGTNLANYILPTIATGLGTIKPAPLLISGLLGTNKTYNGDKDDTIDASGATLFGVIQPDINDVQLDTSAITGMFGQSNVGSGLVVSASGYFLTGNKKDDYTVVAPTGLFANITAKELTVGSVTANDKTYDNLLLATLNTGSAVLNGIVGTDDVTLSSTGASAKFGQTDVGNNLAVSTTGFSLGGGDKSNYTLAQPSLFANITPALLTISMMGNPTKTYDGTAAVTLGSSNFSISGFIGDQGGTVAQSSASYATANAGNNINVTATLQPSDFAPNSGTSMSNYTFAPSLVGTGLGTINPLQLTGQIINNPTKVYDGTTVANLVAGNYELDGFVGSDNITVTQTQGTYDSKDSGVRGVSAALTSGDYQAVGGTLLSNYVLPSILSGFGTITPAPVSIGIVAAISGTHNKVYDGGTDITIAMGDFVLSGFAPGESASVNKDITGEFANKNVGSQPISAFLQQTDFSFSGGANLANYTFPVEAFGTGAITKAPLTVTITGNPTKVYNGSTDVALNSSNFLISGFAGQENGSINPSATAGYDSPNAGTENITAALTAGNYNFTNGALLSNYQIATVATGTGTINQAPLFVTGVFATDKTYNANDVDTLNLDAAGLAGLVDTDAGRVSLDLSGVSATFSQKDVDDHLAVTAINFQITGSAQANYILQPVTGLFANITPASLTLSGITANNKTYDGTSNATLNITILGSTALNGIFSGDSVSFDGSSATGVFNTSNAGAGLKVATSGFKLTGASMDDYVLVQPSGLIATINRAPLTAIITGSPTKVYDGTNSATLTADDYDLQGFVGQDNATIPQSATANYVTKNVGNGLGVASTLVTSDFVATGSTNLANYILPTTGAGSNGIIQPKVIDLTGTRVYDGTQAGAGSLFGELAGVNGETVTVTGSGTLASKNVGDEWAFTNLGNIALANGSNGGLGTNYTLVGGTDWVTITPRALTAVFTADDKTYDGTATATLQGQATLETMAGNEGLIAGDLVSLTEVGPATFSDKNAGSGKTVTGNMTISGGDAGNYTFTQGTTLASITQKHITVDASGHNKAYDGTTTATVDLDSTGVIGGDNVSFSDGAASFSDKNVGSIIGISVTGITANGGDASNYVLDSTVAATEASITPREIHLTGTRVYDAMTDADAAAFMSGGQFATGVASETLIVTGDGSIAIKNVDNSKAVTLGSLALADGSGGGLSSNYVLDDAKLNVTPAPLSAIFTANSRDYNGNTDATINFSSLVGILGSDVVVPNVIAGHFSDKNVGNGKTVTDDITVTGGDAANYTFVHGTAMADITPLAIVVSATGSTRAYDGTTHDNVTLTSDQLVGGDTLTFTAGASDFGDANVGTGKNVSVTGITSSSAGAGNYTFNTDTTTTGSVTPFIINLNGTRVYDGLTDVDASLFGNNGVVNGVNGETLTLTGTSNVADKNVANGKAFDGVDDMTLGGIGGSLSSNYAIGTSSLNITPKGITATITASNKVYDGGVGAITHALLNNVLGSDDVSLASSGQFSDKNVASGKNVSVLTNAMLGGDDASNYMLLSYNPNTTASITPLEINVGATTLDKIYDGNFDATNITTLDHSAILAGDTVNLTFLSANFSDANAGHLKTVMVNGIIGTGVDAHNYIIDPTTTTSASITPVVLDLSGTRVYDGGTTADAFLFGNNGVLAGIGDETLTLSGSGMAGSKNVGTDVAFAGLGSLKLTDGDNGGLASNYTLANGTDTLTITPKPITIGVTGDDKTYDATTAATVHYDTNNGVVSGDDIDFTGTADFTSANAGKNIGIDVSAITATGDDRLNYTYNLTAMTSANITPVILDLTGSRIYDGTTGANAALFGANGVLATGINGETVNLTGSAMLIDKNVGNGKPFAGFGSLALNDGSNGGLAGNYTLVGGTDSVTVTPKTITVGATGSDKSYDGNSMASVTLDGNGVIAGDQISFMPGSATYAGPNAGTGIAISVNGITGNGADLGNYAFNNTASTSGNITPAILDLTGTRTYDSTAGAAASLFGNNGVLTGVNGETLTLTGTGTVSDKNVGSEKGFANGGLNGFGLSGNGGALASNYTLAGGTDWLSITPALLTVVGTTATDRSYDGTRIDALSGSMLQGLIGNDDVTLGNTASGLFDTKNVGNDKSVTTAMTIAGGDMGNYILVQPVGLTANVTPRSITVDATGTDKYFDGNTTDQVTLGSDGVIAGDQLSFTNQGANFSDSGVGNGKTVTVTGIEGSGADAGNYVIADPTTTTTADIMGGQASSFGIGNNTLAQLQSVVGPSATETPYGVADDDAIGTFTGNQKKQHRPIERNIARNDFKSGLSLNVVNGGVKMPANEMP